jgi:hypothetical protein
MKRLRFVPTRSGFVLLTDTRGKLRLLELAGNVPFNRYCRIDSTVPGKQAGWKLEISSANAPRFIAALSELLRGEFDFVFCPKYTPQRVDNNCVTMQLDAWLKLIS